MSEDKPVIFVVLWGLGSDENACYFCKTMDAAQRCAAALRDTISSNRHAYYIGDSKLLAEECEWEETGDTCWQMHRTSVWIQEEELEL